MVTVIPEDAATAFDTYIEINILKTKTCSRFYYFWLRDHCRCLECYNTKTRQISFNILNIPSDIEPVSCEIIDDCLKLEWKDGHRTEFALSWLGNLSFPQKTKREIVLWNQNTVGSLQDTRVPVERYTNDEDGVKQLLKSLLKYGFGFVTGVDPTFKATEVIAKRLALIQKTIFGEMWEVTNDHHYQDTAYTNVALTAHTDNTYFNEPAGLQIFHMLSHEGNGGESLLVDGFNAANNLRIRDKQLFNVLCNNSLEAEYIDKGCHFSAIEPVIKLHPVTKELHHIRFNVYDRALLNTVPAEDVLNFYKAYRAFGKELNESANEFWLKLQPGNVLFIDNWRVLHGRAKFTGKRELCGCYVSRSDWLNRAKVLGFDIE